MNPVAYVNKIGSWALLLECSGLGVRLTIFIETGVRWCQVVSYYHVPDHGEFAVAFLLSLLAMERFRYTTLHLIEYTYRSWKSRMFAGTWTYNLKSPAADMTYLPYIFTRARSRSTGITSWPKSLAYFIPNDGPIVGSTL